MNRDLQDYVGKCINCGFCEAVCPTLEASDFNAYFGARGRVNLSKGFLEGELEEKQVKMSFDSCLQCNACLAVCPAGISAGEISQKMKIHFEKRDPLVMFLTHNILKYKDPLNIGKESSRWSAGLEFEESSSTLLYTARMFQLMPYNSAIGRIRKKFGDNFLKKFSTIIDMVGFNGKLLAPFIDRKESQEFNSSLINIYNLLKKSDIEFTYLGDEEPYSGAMLLEFGMIKEFINYARWLVEFFSQKRIKRIITVDPHTYSLLKYQIKEFIDFPFEVIFYLDLVRTKVDFNGSITLHQACHLERYGERYRGYEILLHNIERKEPVHHDEKMLCCGGPDEVLFPSMTESISEKRYRELKEAGGDVILTMCPICLLNLKKDDKVMDISFFLVRNSR